MLAKRIDYKVYICGVDVPAAAVTVATSVGGIATCSISLAAHPMLAGLGDGDKTQVAVFYLDTWYHRNNPQWCLMFEGYIINISYANSPSARQISINCASNIACLNKLYLELLGGKGGGKIGRTDKITPNEITLRGNYPRRLFTKSLDNKNYITRPSEILYNIILATTGINSEVMDKPSKAPDKKVEEEINRIISISQLNRDRYLANKTQEEKESYYKQEIARLTGLLKAANETVQMQTRWDEDNYAGRVSYLDGAYVRFLVTKLQKDRSINTAAPANSGFFTRFFNLTKFEQHIVSSPIIEGHPNTKTKEPSGVFPMLKTGRGLKYSRILATQSGFKYGENGSALSLVRNLFHVFNYTVTDTICPPIYETDILGVPKGRYTKGSKNNRIAQHMTKPVSYFAVPPACNAIFPCMIRNWQMSVDIDNTPTRLYYDRRSQGRSLNIKSSKKGFADHGTNVGYPATFTRHAQDAQGSKRSDLEVLVFPDEYYKGPNPIFREIDPLFFEIKKQENAGRLKATSYAKPALIDTKDPSFPADQLNLVGQALLKSGASGNEDYALYVKKAQQDFVEARSSARAAQVSMVFNPYILCDFPTMLFDTADSGVHIVGYVSAINHTLTQGQASTSVNLTSVRLVKDMLVGAFNQGMEYPVHPMEPVSEVREVLQRMEPANLYYANLIYRDSLDINSDNTEYTDAYLAMRGAEQELLSTQQLLEEAETDSESHKVLTSEVTRLTDVITSKKKELDSSTQASNSVLNYLKLLSIKSITDAGPSPEQGLEKVLGSNKQVTRNLASQVYTDLLRGVLVPNPAVAAFFEDIDVAMTYVNRPVCTLEQYIDFYKDAPSVLPGSAGLAAKIVGGRGSGTRAGKRFLDDIPNMAPYYLLIREFIPGPGFEPGSKAATLVMPGVESSRAPQQDLELSFRTGSSDSMTVETKVFSTVKSGEVVPLGSLPDTAADWQDLLLRYRAILDLRGDVK